MFCVECFVGHCSNKISDARVGQDELRCPAGGAGGGCTTPITRHEMKAHLPAELMAKVREDATMENENQSCNASTTVRVCSVG